MGKRTGGPNTNHRLGEIVPNTTITPYLFFGGRCEEALAFYRQALGAEVEMLMRYNESPEPPPPGMLPAGFEKKVMHASFRVRGIPLMASDGCGEKPSADAFRLALSLPTEADARRAFDALADGGSVQLPLTKTFWSPCFGMLTDRFGIGWMVTVAGPKN
jgi:PhnB protein